MFTFVVFTLALKVLITGYVAALILSWTTGNILTYALNFLWVFRPEARLTFRGRFLKYMAAGALSVSLNLLALTALVELGRFDPFWSQVALIPFIIVFNFSSAKFWSLRKDGVQK